MALSLWQKAYLAVAEELDNFDHRRYDLVDEKFRSWKQDFSTKTSEELKRIDEEYSNGV